MNKKEVTEIKKLLKLENPYLNIGKIYNAYISEQSDIVWERFKFFDRLEEEDRLEFFEIFKKTLTGGLGKNLNEYKFVKDTSEQLNNGRETVEDLLEEFTEDKAKSFAEKLISSLFIPERWFLTIAECNYSVPPRKSKSKKEDSEDAVEFGEYKFFICSINLMDKTKAGLAWNSKESEINYIRDGFSEVKTAPLCGFLYPLFNERESCVDGFLSYSKDKTTPYVPLVVDVLGGEFNLSPANETALFHKVLRDTCGGTINFGMAKDICNEISNIVKGNIEETEQPKVGIVELKAILKRNNFEDLISSAEENWKETFGSLNVQILAVNVTDDKKTTIKAPDVSISVATEKTHSIQEKIIDGVKCIVIPVTDGGVTVNEMDVK